MSDACVAQLVRAVDRQSKYLGSNSNTVKSVFFLQKDFKFFKLHILSARKYCSEASYPRSKTVLLLQSYYSCYSN